MAASRPVESTAANLAPAAMFVGDRTTTLTSLAGAAVVVLGIGHVSYIRIYLCFR